MSTLIFQVLNPLLVHTILFKTHNYETSKKEFTRLDWKIGVCFLLFGDEQKVRLVTTKKDEHSQHFDDTIKGYHRKTLKYKVWHQKRTRLWLDHFWCLILYCESFLISNFTIVDKVSETNSYIYFYYKKIGPVLPETQVWYYYQY